MDYRYIFEDGQPICISECDDVDMNHYDKNTIRNCTFTAGNNAYTSSSLSTAIYCDCRGDLNIKNVKFNN